MLLNFDSIVCVITLSKNRLRQDLLFRQNTFYLIH
jgi:hypothetical protein